MENFKFVMPASLEKSKDGEWRIRGLASTESKDLQGEIIKAAGMDLSPIDNKKGYLNFEHKNDPANLLGTLDGYTKTPEGLFISGKLFKNHDKAKAVYQIMSSLGEGEQGRIGLSVEGAVHERDPKDPSVITKCTIQNVALTFNPVNTNTYADLIKSLNGSNLNFDLKEESQTKDETETPVFTASQVIDLIQKTLGVGGGYATTTPANMTGGTALSEEALDSSVHNVSEGKKKKKKKLKVKKSLKKMSPELYKANLEKIMEKISGLYPEYSKDVLWACLKDRLETKFPTIV